MKHSASLFIGLIVALACLGAPLSASAHAAPVESIPASSAQLSDAPAEVRIRFSERIEQGASRIVVADEKGATVSVGEARVDPDDAYALSVAVNASVRGAYFVSWSVVSSDDGHFTKGGFAYFVGGQGGAVYSVPQVQIVQLSAVPEALALTVELLGNSLLLGMLALFAFCIRPRGALRKAYAWLAALGVSLAILGEAIHAILKTIELAGLQSLPPLHALSLYLATTSGSATLWRCVLVVAFAAVAFSRRRSILASERVTTSEAVLAILLVAFAYLRARVSHAAASPFYPELSIAVNALHLIGKDLWIGIAAILPSAYFSRVLRPLLSGAIAHAGKVLSVAFTVVAVTAPYIIWLHLKEPSNLTATLWGERFVPLAVAAALLVVMRIYHIAAARWKQGTLRRFIVWSLPIELSFALLVAFFSSLMIITSPPIEKNRGHVFEAESNGAVVRLERAPYEDGGVLISADGAQIDADRDPTVVMDGEEGLVLGIERRFGGGYAFPLSAVTAGHPHQIDISFPQKDAYDARASFLVARSDFDAPPRRRFDGFALSLAILAAAGLAGGIVMYRLSGEAAVDFRGKGFAYAYCLALVGGLFVASQAIAAGSSLFANDFKKECVADGNSWHLMLPTKSGLPVSSVPQEGCMALGGAFMFADAREYRALKAPGESHVTFSTDLQSITAGVPTPLDFSIRDKAGKPALLSIQHERLIHLIVISADMREFQHLHQEDSGPLTEKATKDSTFSIPVTFPKSGDYIVAVDYASGLSLRSEFFPVHVTGGSPQGSEVATYPSRAVFDGYEVSLDLSFPVVGMPSTLTYRIKKDGKDVYDLEPYLAAAMHLAVVKNDLSDFSHVHGEVHPPGAPVQPLTASTVHNHAPPPPSFGPIIEAHPIFASPGLYTIFGQFKRQGKVVTTRFTVRIDE